MGRWGALLAGMLVVVVGLLVPSAQAAKAPSDTVWLCFPGKTPNPCHESNETTITAPDGTTTVEDTAFPRKPPLDCFYIYPTVSGQPTTNADKTIDPEQIAIARYQAARFSLDCKVYAPMYRQLTLAAITTTSSEGQADAIRLAYSDVRAAWRDYLANYNNGRPFVLLGHSQGAGMLTGLLRKQIEPHRKVLDRMVSANLLGGNVTTERGSDTGGSFRHVPLCTQPKQFGCVVAYSTFNETPPDDTKFGRPTGRFADVFGTPSGTDQEVACTNPADLAGSGPAPLRTLARTEPFPGALGVALTILYGGPPPTAPTPWLVPQDRYTAECVTANEAHVLMVSPVGASNPLHPSPDATWGLHLGDVNLPLGDLVSAVKRQGKAYMRASKP